MSSGPGPAMVIRDAEPRDVGPILALVKELAEYERMSHLVRASEADYHAALFPDGAAPAARAAVVEVDGAVVGYMVWFRSFSTFWARPKLYLEDLYVQPAQRGRGLGKAMLAELARRAVDEGIAKVQWQVLDWNAPAIAFYRSLGAEVTGEWLDCSLTGEALAAMARCAVDG